MKKSYIFWVLGVVIVILIALIAKQETSARIALPADAEKIFPCVVNMGEHWARAADLPFGPIYLVNEGKVVGIEYDLHEDELKKITGTVAGAQTGDFFAMSALGAKYDHMDLNYLVGGHEGDEDAHYDVHMYTISSEAKQQITCE